MTYTDFLKTHFGDDGSLARVMQELGDHYVYMHRGIYLSNGFILEILWDHKSDIFNQGESQQRKIAELLGWRE